MKKILLLLAILFISFTAKPSHVRGGEITWECLYSGSNSGKLIFSIKLYFTCEKGASGDPLTAAISNPLYAVYGGPSSISCAKISVIDISPVCDSGNGTIACGQLTSSPTSKFAYREITYQSQPVQINGIPLLTGSSFWYSSCCRPSAVNTSGSGLYLRAVMFPYTNPVTLTVLSLGSTAGGPSCYDSSPKFAERVTQYGFSNKMNYFTIKSLDPDCDSLQYEITWPMQSATNGITWKSGYSMLSPLPGTSFNSSNVPLEINGKNGNAQFKTMGGAGLYSIAYKVISYKNQIKVGEIYRDYTLSMGLAATDIYSKNNKNPQITFKNNSASSYAPTYTDTFNVGEMVHINIKAVDLDFLSGTVFQSVSLRLIPDPAIGDASSSYDCKLSSCAYLDTNSTFWNGSEFKNSLAIIADFKWQLNCDALVKPCMNSPIRSDEYYTYNFSVVATDNLCPMPLSTIASFSITVIDTNIREGKFEQIVSIDSLNHITWKKNSGTSFLSYNILRSDSANGPFVLLDSISNINDTTYTDTLTKPIISNKYYRIIASGASNCTAEKNTISSILLSVLDTLSYNSELNWNGLYYQGTRFISGYYLIEADTGNGWMIIDSISHDCYKYVNLYSYTDTILTCSPSIDYRIEAFDLSNDIEYLSNVDSARYIYPIIKDSLTICGGDSVWIGGMWRDTSGTYLDVKQTFQGCDSLVEIKLKVNPAYNINNAVSICEGDSVLIHGIYRKTSGQYDKKYRTKLKCDSLVNIQLNVKLVDTGVTSNGRYLTANATGSTYQWVQCPTFSNIKSTSRTYLPNANGNYAVIVLSNGCVDTSACYEINAVGILENKAKGALKLYPNPADNGITFQWSKIDLNTYKLVIYDTKGTLVYEHTIDKSLFQVSTSDIPSGLYYYKVVSAEEELNTGRFMIRH